MSKHNVSTSPSAMQNYKETCSHIDDVGGTLSANCGNNKGGSPYSEISDSGNGEIMNNFGKLVCQ